MSTCRARLADCHCSVDAPDHDLPAAIHACQIPGCGALWVSPDLVVRLPRRVALPRRYDRADLRSVA